MRFVQYGDSISKVRILSSDNNHALLLTLDDGDVVAIKTGFSSGYTGEGPRTFSATLRLLRAYEIDITEYDVKSDLLERLDDSGLTADDLDLIDGARPVRPTRWADYIFENDWKSPDGEVWLRFPLVLPLAAIDPRLVDLAMRFQENEDKCLLDGYRRLEDIVRERTGLDEHGVKLFSQAFQGATAALGWEALGGGEQSGRGQLFAATYMAYRNPRAHRKVDGDSADALTEFLLLNHLYRLEAMAVERDKAHANNRSETK